MNDYTRKQFIKSVIGDKKAPDMLIYPVQSQTEKDGILDAFKNDRDSHIVEIQKDDMTIIAVVSTSDEDLLDYLDHIGGGYTNKVILRDSSTGRGWRLHETGHDNAVAGVRDAIKNYMKSRAIVSIEKAYKDFKEGKIGH